MSVSPPTAVKQHPEIRALVREAARGKDDAIAKLISLAEDLPGSIRAIEQLLGQHRLPSAGGAFLIGLTGPPGCGKSTLIDKLIDRYRRGGERVGVIAVDPTSSFTGGAVLGDRVRMNDHCTDPGVFIRSMASRGELGGMARATATAARILAASRKNVVIIETVGVGQLEVAVRKCVHLLGVVLTPSSGDDIQFMKAGIMEMADVFILNKADELRNPSMLSALREMIEDHPRERGSAWRVPVISTVALENQGIDEMYDVFQRFRAHRGEVES